MFHHPRPAVFGMEITSRRGDSCITPTAIFIFHRAGGNRHGQLLTNVWICGERDILSDRQFPTSAIYYEYNVVTLRNTAVTVRFL